MVSKVSEDFYSFYGRSQSNESLSGALRPIGLQPALKRCPARQLEHKNWRITLGLILGLLELYRE